jgi:hypothetical protein
MSIDARVPGWSSARSRSAATRVAAEFRIRAQVQPPVDTRSPSFMLKLTGFFARNPALGVPALGGHWPAKGVIRAGSAVELARDANRRRGGP